MLSTTNTTFLSSRLSVPEPFLAPVGILPAHKTMFSPHESSRTATLRAFVGTARTVQLNSTLTLLTSMYMRVFEARQQMHVCASLPALLRYCLLLPFAGLLVLASSGIYNPDCGFVRVVDT